MRGPMPSALRPVTRCLASCHAGTDNDWAQQYVACTLGLDSQDPEVGHLFLVRKRVPYAGAHIELTMQHSK